MAQCAALATVNAVQCRSPRSHESPTKKITNESHHKNAKLQHPRLYTTPWRLPKTTNFSKSRNNLRWYCLLYRALFSYLYTMKTVTKKKSAHATRDGFVYLTKRTVIRKAQTAGKKAALQAMSTMGYVVTTNRGWVVKKYADGSIQKIAKIAV